MGRDDDIRTGDLELYEYARWEEVMAKYREAYREWYAVPTWLLWVLFVVSLYATVYYNMWFLVLVVFTSHALGSRGREAKEIFQIGYEWGLEEGISRVFDGLDRQK